MGRIKRWISRKWEASRRRWQAARVRRAWIRATFFPGGKWRKFLLRAYVAYVLACFFLSAGFHLLFSRDYWDERIAIYIAMLLTTGRVLRWLLPEMSAILRAQMPAPPKPRNDPPPPPADEPGASGSPSPVLPAAPAPTLEASCKLPTPSLTDAGAR